MLAFACAFTMFAGAAFTDQADIKVDADAVDTLVSLGIVEGFEDGSFQPNATVTRAQMAKMIYVLRTGKSDASAYNDDKTSFTDIGSHWARGYIKYCQSLGIIAGKSNTIFAPNATVTAQEAAKMLLVTLGYNAEKAGLVGANWASKTNALADENGLLEDVNTSFTSACPRQYAAQLIYNAIDTPTVVWRDDAYTNTNYKDEDNQTIGEKYMGLESDTGMLVAAGKVGLDGQKYDEDQIVLKHVNKNDVGKNVDDTVTLSDVTGDYSALLGQHVKVLHKVTKTGVNNSKDNLSKDWTVEVRAYFTDGTNKKVTVDKLNGKDIASSVDTDDLANHLYTYTTDKDGNYELKELAQTAGTSALNGAALTKNMAGYDTYNTTAKYYSNAKDGTTGTWTAYYNKRLNNTIIAEDAVLFVVANNEIKVVSGKTARDWNNNTATRNYGFLTAESNGISYVKVAAVKVNSDDVVKADGDKLYAYVTEDAFETKKDGDTVTAFKAIVGNSTEAVDLYEDGTSHRAAAKAGTVIVYTVDGDEIDVQAVVSAADYTYRNSGAYAIKGFDGKKKGDMSLVKADGTVTSVTLDEDCVFIGVDDAKNVGTVSEIGAVPTSADKDEFDRYDMNAYVVFNSDGKIAAVVYDTVNNELDITPVKTATTDGNTYTATGFSGKTFAVTGETATVTTLAGTSVKAGVKSTLTVTLSATPAKDVTVVVNGDNGVGNVAIVVKKGQTSGTAQFTMPTANTAFTFVSADAAK